MFNSKEKNKDSIELEKLKVTELKKALSNSKSTSKVSIDASTLKQVPSETQFLKPQLAFKVINETAVPNNQSTRQSFKSPPRSSSKHGSFRSESKSTYFESENKIDSNAIPFLILIKDTRIASMLFVVSIVFVATYLPSILAICSRVYPL